MIQIAPIQYEYVRYFIIVDEILTQINEPSNWNTTNKEYLRSKQYHGFTVKISDLVQFNGESAVFLESLYREKGGNALAYIIEERRNSDTDDWEEVVTGELDFTTVSFGYGEFNIKINSESLAKVFQSRWRTELNVLKKTNLDGDELDLNDLQTRTVAMHDRGLEGRNTLDIGTEYSINLAHPSDTTYSANAILFTKLEDSFYSLPKPMEIAREKYIGNSAEPYKADIDNLFFIQRQATTVPVTFDINVVSEVSISNYMDTVYQIELMIYNLKDNASTYTYEYVRESYDILTSVVAKNNNKTTLNYSGSVTVDLKPNQGVSLAFVCHGKKGGSSDSNIVVKAASVRLSGATVADGTSTQVIMPYDFFQRHILLMSGGLLDSEYLTKCRHSITTGFMIRNVPQTTENPTPISITFQKLYNSFDSITPIGLDISRNTVKIEKREYFYQTFLSHDFGNEITKVEFSYDKESSYSEINIGFSTSNFSKEDALDEFNVRTVFTTPISKFRKKYNAVSDIQGSGYVMEKLRRIQYNADIERTQSRRGDSTKFLMDLEDNEYKIRKYETDFVGFPTNLYNSAAAYNFRFSPMNRLRQQSKWLTAGLYKDRDKFFTFSSSTGNTSMVTQPIGEPPMAEDGNFPINDAGRPRFVNERVKFQVKPVNFNAILNQRVDGVKRYYGLFSFLYRGEKRYGYLLSYKPENFEVQLQLIQS